MQTRNHYTSILCYIESNERFNRDMALQSSQHGNGQGIGAERFEKLIARRVFRYRRRRTRNVLRLRVVYCGSSGASFDWSSTWMPLDFLAHHRVHHRKSIHFIAKYSIGMHRLCALLS